MPTCSRQSMGRGFSVNRFRQTSALLARWRPNAGFCQNHFPSTNEGFPEHPLSQASCWKFFQGLPHCSQHLARNAICTSAMVSWSVALSRHGSCRQTARGPIKAARVSSWPREEARRPSAWQMTWPVPLSLSSGWKYAHTRCSVALMQRGSSPSAAEEILSSILLFTVSISNCDQVGF